jgi:hypothetical protein
MARLTKKIKKLDGALTAAGNWKQNTFNGSGPIKI